MILLRFLLLPFLLAYLLPGPLSGQRGADRLAVSAPPVKSCAGLVKYFKRSYRVQDNGKTYLSLGLRYDRATTLAANSQLALERQSRAGFPLLAGFRLGELVIEAGGFLGLEMCRPQDAAWFNAPVSQGRQISNASGLMLGMGMQVFEDCRLNLQYTHLDDLPEDNVLGRLNLGWQWTW